MSLPTPVITIPESKLKKGFVFEITTTALCDLACTYCFEGEKTDSRRLDNNIENIIDNIKKVFSHSYFQENYDVISLTFWGGEPSLNPKLINRFIEEFHNYNIGNLKFEFMMYSNGFNLANLKTILDYCKQVDCEDKFILQISYDGKIINDKFRITKTYKTTSNKVLENFIYIANNYNLHSLDLKSTLPLHELSNIVENWKEFYVLDQYIKKHFNTKKNVSVSYAPTLDYINALYKYPKADQDRIIDQFRTDIEKITLLEFDYYKHNKYFLMTWFKKGKEQRSHCTAGAQIINLNVDGTLNYCHGSIYIKDKEDLQVKDLSFLNELDNEEISKIINFIQYFAKYIWSEDNIADSCKNCDATYCAVCPAAIYSINKNINNKADDNQLTDNLYNYDSNFLNCIFYKIFGQFDRALHQALIKGNL